MIFIFINILKLILLNIFIFDIIYHRNDLFVIKSKSHYTLNNENSNLFNNGINKTIYEFNYLKKIDNKTYYFQIAEVRYFFSFIHKMVKIEYNICFYDEKRNLISPSDFTLYSNISLLCNIEIIYNNLSIDSLASIKDNKYFNCIEYFNLNENITIGIKLYNIYENVKYNYTLLFTDNFFNYMKIKFNKDKIFDSLIINYEYNLLIQNINNSY